MSLRARGRLLVAALFVAAAAAGPGCSRRRTARVSEGPIEQRIAARAEVVAEEGEAVLQCERSGRVLRVLVREGEAVAEGAAVVELSPEGGGSPVLVLAERAGVVLDRHVRPGDRVEPRQSLVGVVDPARTELRIEVEEPDAPAVAVGLPVALTLPGGGAMVGRGAVTRVSARLESRRIGASDARARAEGWVRPAWVRWSEGAPAGLSLGQRLEALLALPPRKAAVRVPRRAIHVREGRAWVDRPWGLWSRETPVELGATDGEFAEVSGLAVGTEVEMDDASR